MELRERTSVSEPKDGAPEALALFERLSLAKDLGDILDVVVERVQVCGPYDGVLVNLLDEAGSNLICENILLPPDYEAVRETYLYFKFPLSAGDANAICFREGRPLLITAENAGHYPGTTHTRFLRWRMHSALVVPLFYQSRCLGTVMVFNQQRPLNLTEAPAVQTVAERLGAQIQIGLEHTRLQRKARLVENTAREQREFLQFITKVNNIDSLERICEEITAEFLRRTPFDLAGVVLREGQQLALHTLKLGNPDYAEQLPALERFYREHPFQIDVADGAIPTAFLQDSILYFPDTRVLRDLPMSAKDQRALELLGTARSIFMSPIRRRDRPMGILWLISLARPVPMAESDKEFIEMLCAFIGTAMGNAQLYEIIGRQNAEIEALNNDLRGKVEQLGQLATTDRLTGLHNFGCFESELARRAEEYRRKTGDKLSLVLIDVDHFKRFNDTYGHLAGNEVLRQVASRIRAAARKMDLPCRYGGEEFVVLLPACDLAGARRFADRLRKDIAGTPLYAAEPDEVITVSAGCATYQPGEDVAVLLERADRALYRAKEAGRNRVEVAAPAEPTA